MKKAASVETPKKKTSKAVQNTPDKSYLELRLPRITFRNTSLNVYLVFALVIFAFLLGMLTNKVLYLEKLAKAPAPAVAPVAAAPTVPEPPAVVKVNNGHFPLLGDKNAKVTVVEFADLRCPFCERFFTDTLPLLKKDYIDTGKVKLAFRNYDFLGPASTLAGEASECANEQGKFWDYHDYMYQNQPSESDTSMYTVDNLSQIAGSLGMDQSQFQDCLSNNKFDKDFQDDMTTAGKVQVDGTPTFFINGHRLVGAQPYTEFQKLIDAELKK